ncbi:hypothetical protein KC345_g6545 [Hortaea werneckii]|nr:hypothetical protein KC345_g6545 [Hortaea werneckii]
MSVSPIEQRPTRCGNMLSFRFWQNNEILKAFDDDDYERLDTLCAQALENPALPRYYRAQYEMLTALVPGRDAKEHLEASMRSIHDMEQLLDAEGRERVEVRRLKARVEELMGCIVEERVRVADTHLAFDSEADLEIASSEEQTVQQMNEQPTYMPESQATTSYPTSDVSIEAGMSAALISSPRSRQATPMTSPSKLGKRKLKEEESQEADSEHEAEGEGI